MHDRNMQVANAFRDAYPDNTERVAAETIRRGPPAVGNEAADQALPDATADAAAAAGNVPAGAAGSSEVDGEEVEGGEGTAGIENTPPRLQGEGAEWSLECPLWAENVGEWGQEWTEESDDETPAQELVPDGEVIPGGNGPLSAEDNFRLANAYAQAYPRETNRARAEIYGEENPHFTVQRARIQVSLCGVEAGCRNRINNFVRCFFYLRRCCLFRFGSTRIERHRIFLSPAFLCVIFMCFVDIDVGP